MNNLTQTQFSSEYLMSELFNVYYDQCSSERIKYTAQEMRDGFWQSWIVMDGIELSHMVYQGEPQYIFMCSRYSTEYGDDVYYFKTYEDCKKVWLMNQKQLDEYARKLHQYFCDIDGNELKVGDKVVLLDADDLDYNAPTRGSILEVIKLDDIDSNYINFSDVSLFGHRVLKIKNN